MRIDLWFDPGCPWCWINSRWVTEVAPQRDLDVRWRPFSLLMKNGGPERVPERYREQVIGTHGLLRVIQATIDRTGDDHAARDLYTRFGTAIHHDRVSVKDVDVEASLGELGLPTSLATARDDAAHDAAISESMDEALALAGQDVGTPLMGFEGRSAYFGPVLTPAPTGDAALRLWDAVVVVATTPGFYELKRSRDVGPQFGARPDVPLRAVAVAS